MGLKTTGTVLSLCFLFLAQFAAGYEKDLNLLSIKMSREVVRQEKKRVAVADFTAEDGRALKAGTFLADELARLFSEKGKKYEAADSGFEMVERIMMQKYTLISGGSFNIPALKKLREETKADALVMGFLNSSKGFPVLNLRILDLNTGKTLSTFSQKLTLTAPLKKLMDQDQSEPGSAQTTSAAQDSEKSLMDELEKEDPSKGSTPAQIFNEFKIEFVKAVRNEYEVIAEFKVTSQSDVPVKIYFYPRETRFIGSDGNTYGTPFLSFSGTADRNWGSVGGTQAYPGISMPLRIKFPNVAKTVKLMQVTEINLMVEGTRNGTVIFRNLPVQ